MKRVLVFTLAILLVMSTASPMMLSQEGGMSLPLQIGKQGSLCNFGRTLSWSMKLS